MKVYLHDHGAFSAGCGERCGWYFAGRINDELVAEVKAALRSMWPLDPDRWPSDKNALAIIDAIEKAP